MADILQICIAPVCEAADQGGIDFIEDDPGKIACDLLFVATAFGDGLLEEAGLGAMLRAESGSPEEQAESANSMGIVQTDDGFKVDFVISAGAGEGAAIVETPGAAVGEDAPANAPVGIDVGIAQVT